MESLVDELIFLQRGGALRQLPLVDFQRDFRCFGFRVDGGSAPQPDALIENVDLHGREPYLYSFADREPLESHLATHWPQVRLGEEQPLSLEDSFIGLTGKY